MNQLTKELLKLRQALMEFGFIRIAEEVADLSNEYAEPWHEEAVQEFGGEPISEDEYLQKINPPDPEDLLGQKDYVKPQDADLYLQVAKQENFHLSGAGNKSPLLGSGVYGKVFSGMYQGKLAAAKIVFSSISILNSEIIKWYKILQAIKTLPTNLQQHFPQIYHLNRNQIISYDRNGNPNSLDYDIIIMEQLRPLPKELYKLLEEDDFNFQKYQRLKTALKDEEYLYQMATLLADVITNEPRFRFDMKKFKPTAPEIMKVLLDNNIQVSSPDLTAATLATKINQYLLNKYPFREKYRNFLLPLLTDNLKGMFTGKPHRTSSSALTPVEFHSYESYSPLWSNLPEMKDLYQVLIQLAQEYNIKWSDLHNDNLMLGQDGHIKIIDVGLFSIS